MSPMRNPGRWYRCCWKLIHLGLALAGLLTLSACGGSRETIPNTGSSAGDPTRGRELIQHYGCHSCHTIPGVPGANSLVGPPLIAWSERHYIAGAIQNTPENLILWITDPQSIEPGTAMPDVGADEQDARDISAYLYTLDRGFFGGLLGW